MFTDNQTEFKKWVYEHSDPLFNYVMKRGLDEHTAKDVVQETFIAAWRNMDNFKGDASVKNWLFVIVKSKMTDHFRKQAGKKEVAEVQSSHDDHTFFDETGHWKKGMHPKQWSVDFSNLVEAKEFNQIFSSCCKRLKQVQNAVFVMKHVDGKDSEEICKDLGISASNYWVIIHRAKVQLRACLEQHWL